VSTKTCNISEIVKIVCCSHHAEVPRHPQGLREVLGLGRLAVIPIIIMKTQ